jgi:hypothetical protein
MFHRRVMAVDSKCPSQALCSCCPSTGISVLSMLTTTRWGWGPPRPPPRSQFLIDSPQTIQIPAWLAPQSRTNADAKATLPAIQIFSEPINRNLARDRQEYFRPGMEIGRSSLPSGRTLALYILYKSEQYWTAAASRLAYFLFLASRAQPLALVVAFAWVHQAPKTGIGVPDSVSSVRFWLTLLNDLQGMGSYGRFATET